MSVADSQDVRKGQGSLLSAGESVTGPATRRQKPVQSLLAVAELASAVTPRDIHRSAREQKAAGKPRTEDDAAKTQSAKPVPASRDAAEPPVDARPAEADRPAVVSGPDRPNQPEPTVIASRMPVQRAPLRGDEATNPYWRPLIDPMTVIAGVARSRSIILTTTILGGILGVAIALSTPKLYESRAEILVDPRNLNIVDREITQAGLPSDATLAIVENQVRVMTSGTVIDKVVQKLNLAADPEFNGLAGSGFSISAAIEALRSILSADDAGDERVLRQALAVEHLYESLHVERGGKTFVISVSARTQEPEKSALIANTLTTEFLETYGELQSSSAGRATSELTSRLDELRQSVEDAERKVEAFKAENEIIDSQGRLITDDELVKLNEQLSVARARTLELNARAQSAGRVDVDQVLDGTLPEQATSGLMTELRSQYATLKQESDRLAVQLGPRHPQRISIEAQLEGARGQIENELRRLKAGVQVDLKRAVQLEQDLASRLAQLKVQKGDLSNELVTLREMERDASSKRAVYEAYLLRARETGEQQSLNTANVSVISTASPALLPVGPSRSMVVLAGAFLGLFAGIGIGAARGVYRSFRDRADAEQAEPLGADRLAQPPKNTSPRPVGPAEPDGKTDRKSETDMMHLVHSDIRERREAPENESQAYGAPQNQWQPQAYQPQPYPQQPIWQGPAAYYPQDPNAAPPQQAGQQPFAGQPGFAPQPPQGWQHPFYPPSFQQSPIHPQMAHPQAMHPQAGYPYYPQPGQPMAPPAWSQQEFHAPAPQADPNQHASAHLNQRAQPASHLSVVEPSPDQQTRSAIDEIRDSLREFREAIRELTESRKARRYF